MKALAILLLLAATATRAGVPDAFCVELGEIAARAATGRANGVRLEDALTPFVDTTTIPAAVKMACVGAITDVYRDGLSPARARAAATAACREEAAKAR